jgi:hypothetical protein
VYSIGKELRERNKRVGNTYNTDLLTEIYSKDTWNMHNMKYW